MAKMKNKKYSVIVSPKVAKLFKKYINDYSYCIESGGILIGRIDSDSKKIYLDDITEPYVGDKRSKYRFVRLEEGHQGYMDRVWKESGKKLTYIGEWHTHNQSKILASSVDKNNWRRIARQPHNTNELVFIILGKKGFNIWVCKNGIIKKVAKESIFNA